MLFPDILLGFLLFFGIDRPCMVIHIVHLPQLPVLLILRRLFRQTFLGFLIMRSHSLLILLIGHLNILMFLLNDLPLIVIKHRYIVLFVGDIVDASEQNEAVFVDSHSVAVAAFGDFLLGLVGGDQGPFVAREVPLPQVTEFMVQVASPED
jgi:hypothetical protein